MYEALARGVLDEANREEVASRVEHLRRRYPRASRDALARRLVRRTALQCAATGALLAGPAAYFGAIPFGSGLAQQISALNRLVLALAALYGRPTSGKDRVAGVSAGVAAGLSSEILRQGIVRLLREAFPRRPGARTFVGAVIGGVLGYGAALAIGGLAQEVFRGRRSLPLWARR
jgi:hypothetical protein